MSEVRQKLSIGQKAVLALAMAGSAASLFYGLRAASADLVGLRARWQLNQWQTGVQKYSNPADWAKVRNDLLSAQSILPGDPLIHESLGYLYAIRAGQLTAVPVIEQAMIDDAIGAYRSAIGLRPMSPYAWANLAMGLHLRDIEPEQMWQAFDRAWLYGNREAGVQRMLAEIGFSRWNLAGAERQAQLVAMVNDAYPHIKGDLVKIATKYEKQDLLAE